MSMWVFAPLPIRTGADKYPRPLQLFHPQINANCTLPTEDKRQMLVSVSGFFVQRERGFRFHQWGVVRYSSFGKLSLSGESICGTPYSQHSKWTMTGIKLKLKPFFKEVAVALSIKIFMKVLLSLCVLYCSVHVFSC